MAHLVDGLVVGLPAASRSALVARADGIPLYAVETVRALIDRDLVVPRDGQYVPAAHGVELDLDAIGAPASLQALVAARLDTLTTAERRVVTDASVLGASFTLDGIIALGANPDDVQELLDSLRRKEIITLQTDRFSAELGQYRFVQSVVRQVAYATQSRRDRTARHLAAADHLADLPDPSDDLAVVIARHLLDAIDAAPNEYTGTPSLAARACTYLERAAARARRVGAPGDAQRLLEVALDSAQGDDDRARLHLFAAEVAENAGHRADARAHAQAALTLFEVVHDPIGSGRAAAALSYSTLGLSTFGDNSAAVAIAETRWQALEGVAGAERARFELALALATAHAGLGSLESQLWYAERMLFLAEALNDPGALAKALEALGSTYLRGGAHQAGVILLEAAAVIAREHDYPLSLARALGNLGAFLNGRDVRTALRHQEQARDVARRAGLQALEENSRVNIAVGLWCSGRLTEAAGVVPEGIDITDPQRDIAWRTLQVWMAEAQGTTLPAPVADTAADTDSQSNLAWLRSADLARAVVTGDRDEATHLAPQVLDHLLAASGLDDDFFVLWPPAVLAALGAEDLDLAERLLAPVTEALPGQRAPAVAAQWHRLRGLVAAARGDDPEFTETELRAGIDALATFGAAGFQAQTQEELGRWLVTQSRPDEAAPLLDAARRAYAEIGATGWLARLDTWQTSLQR